MSTLRVQLATTARSLPFNGMLANARPVRHRAVVGLYVEGKERRYFQKSMLWGDDPHTSTCQVPEDAALRLDTFVRRHYVTRELMNFGPFSFMRYMSGLDERSYDENHARSIRYGGQAVDTVTLETMPYRPYVMLGDRGRRKLLALVGFTETHSLVALDDVFVPPGRQYHRRAVTNVNATYHPLIIASNRDLMQAYGAETLIAVERIG